MKILMIVTLELSMSCPAENVGMNLATLKIIEDVERN
jgi:hypothetical protein